MCYLSWRKGFNNANYGLRWKSIGAVHALPRFGLAWIGMVWFGMVCCVFSWRRFAYPIYTQKHPLFSFFAARKNSCNIVWMLFRSVLISIILITELSIGEFNFEFNATIAVHCSVHAQFLMCTIERAKNQFEQAFGQ